MGIPSQIFFAGAVFWPVSQVEAGIHKSIAGKDLRRRPPFFAGGPRPAAQTKFLRRKPLRGKELRRKPRQEY